MYQENTVFRIFSNRISILIVLSLCLVLRLSFFAAFQPWQEQTEKQEVLKIDALGYHELATNLLQNKSFSYEVNGKPDALRTPGYPLFIAAIYSVFGNAPWVVMLFQIVLDTVTCLILMLTLSRLFTHRVAFVSSLFYALDPFLVFYCSTLLSDILFVFLLVLSSYAFAAAYRSGPGGKGDWYYASYGLLLGIATLVRPISVYILLLLALFFFAGYWKDKTRAIRLTAICSITFFLAIFPWLFRNYVTFDRLSLSTSGQFNLLFYWAEPIEMERLNIDRASAEKLLDAEVEREVVSDGLDLQKVNQFQVADIYQRLAIRIFSKNPLSFVKTYTKGIIFNFLNLNTEGFAHHLHMRTAGVDKRWYSSYKDMLSDFISKKPPEAIVIGGLILFFLAITYSLSVVGFVASWSRYDHKVLLFLFLMSSYFILLTGANGNCRFKLPSLPFYLCFAGTGFEYIYRRAIRLRKNTRLELSP